MKFPQIFRTSVERRCDTAAMTRGKSAPPELPALPAWKAFVVQFSRDASEEAGIFTGRIEHLSSGRRAYFRSRDELVATLERLLAELGHTPT